MKIRNIALTFILMMSASALFANSQTEKFKVYGNCGMCETRIENAAKGIDGVASADWDKETKMLEVTFDDSKTDIHEIHSAVAAVGHDTEMHKAKDEIYNSLPGCCKYDRATSGCCEKSHE